MCGDRPARLRIAQALLAAGVNPNQRGIIGPIMYYVALCGDLALARTFVEAGGDIKAKRDGDNLIDAAFEAGSMETAEYFRSLGVPWATPYLRHACKIGDRAMAEVALKAGADVNSCYGTTRDTPLTIACAHGQVDLVGLLLAAGADPKQKLDYDSALLSAVRFGKSTEAVDLLLAAGVGVDSRVDGDTALMAAAKEGDLAMVQHLVARGADVAAKNPKDGMNAADAARHGRHREVVQYLKTQGAAGGRDQGLKFARALAREFQGPLKERGFPSGRYGLQTFCQISTRFAGFPSQFAVANDGFEFRAFDYRQIQGTLRSVWHFARNPPETGREQVLREVDTALLPPGFRLFCEHDKGVEEETDVLAWFDGRRESLAGLLRGERDMVVLAPKGAVLVGGTTDLNEVRQRLAVFADLLKRFARPPEPARQLWMREWLLKPVAKKDAATLSTRHAFGGSSTHPVACAGCGAAANCMARIDLGDPTITKSPLGAHLLEIPWCLACGDWGPMFYPLGRNLLAIAGGALPEPGDSDLAEKPLQLVPVPSGKKAGRKSKLGGKPNWLQSDEAPDCPECHAPMAFVLQLASDARISYGDLGMLYAFICPECRKLAVLAQSR